MVLRILHIALAAPWWLLTLKAVATSSPCSKLQESLIYTQEETPQDLSSVFPVVVEKINRVLDSVVDVQVDWTGAVLHDRVGEHIVECTVTRLLTDNEQNDRNTTTKFDDDDDDEESVARIDESGRKVTSQCFHVPFTILDTDECTLPPDHAMRHVCSSPSICVNTNGSYECSCPRSSTSDERSPWEVSFSSSGKTTCPSSPSTVDCCPVRAHSAEGKRCRERFRCPVDPCEEDHECAASATCVRAESPNIISKKLYSCQCPEGLMGNGKACRLGIDPPPQPKVMFDGVTPTALTLKNNYYCGCTKPRVDACSGFPPCQGKHEVCIVSATTGNKPVCDCKPGYVRHEKYGCVDVNPPELVLRNDPQGNKILKLKQGDEYREHMVDITDGNAEDYLRSLKVTYSRPLPTGCLLKTGEFHVNYTIAMPWANPPHVTVTRRVLIEDINECSIPLSGKKYQQNCPQLMPQCDIDAGAECSNLDGGYTCRCPVHTNGDGFLKSTKFGDSLYPVPSSYKGGTSCVDTSKPVITIHGPNPKVFKVSQCGGLNGVMSSYSRNNQNDDEKEKLSFNQRALYETDIKEMIRATVGAELCATNENPNVNPRDCVQAIDRTYKGDVDLSSRVRVGDPVQKSRSHWRLPYDVEDDAGNQAVTVYRDVVVEEVNLIGIEKKIREEVLSGEKRKTKRAIDNAVRAERKKWDAENKASNNNSRRNTPQPVAETCPVYDCPETDVVNAATCSAFCSNVSTSCRRQLREVRYIFTLLFWLDDTFPAKLPLVLIIAFFLIVFIYVLKGAWTLLFNPKAYSNYDYKNHGSINDEMVLATQPEPRQRAQTQRNNEAFDSKVTAYGRSTPSAPISTTNNYLQNGSNSNGGAFFSPGSLGSPPPPPENNLLNNNPSTPAAAERFDVSAVYQSPPLITPSKTGEGARRRSPYK